MEKYYAQTLWQLVEGGMKPAKAIASLRTVLTNHGRLALLPRIGKAFARIAEREVQKTTVTLTVAREKDERKAKTAAKAVLKELDAKNKELDVKVDESLIGGWRLEGREVLVDRSFKKSLLDVYNRATK